MIWVLLQGLWWAVTRAPLIIVGHLVYFIAWVLVPPKTFKEWNAKSGRWLCSFGIHRWAVYDTFEFHTLYECCRCSARSTQSNFPPG